MYNLFKIFLTLLSISIINCKSLTFDCNYINHTYLDTDYLLVTGFTDISEIHINCTYIFGRLNIRPENPLMLDKSLDLTFIKVF